MKITFVTNMRLPNERGISYSVVTMCQALTRAGAEVELLAPNCRIPDSMKNETIWHYHDIKKNTFKFSRLPFLDLPIPHLFYLILNWTFALSAVFRLLVTQAKIVHLFNDARELLFVLKIISFIYKPLVVFELHIRPTDWYNKFLEKISLSRIDLLLVTTNQFKSHYIENGVNEKKIIVFPNAINIEDFDYRSTKSEIRKELRLPVDAFIIGYAGRFTTMGVQKGIPELIKTVSLLSKKYPKIVLICVGGADEELESQRHEIAKTTLPEGKVLLIGNKSRMTLYRYMRSFDVCAMPFPWTKHYAYNMSPLKMFEYMATKNPIIATNLPSIKEILFDNKNSLLVKPGDYKNLANKVELLLKDSRLRQNLGRQAFLEVSENYTWLKRGKAELDFLKTLQSSELS